MKVLLTGATGFVGREVLRQLHATGHEARVLVRHEKSAAERLPHPNSIAEFHHGDVTQPHSLAGAAQGCDAVIHLVGIISEFGNVTFERLHVESTRDIVAAAQREGVRRFIHMSALGTRANAASRYHQTKWAAEEIVRTSALDYTIFQPSVIYGAEDHFVNLFAKMARMLPVVPVIGSGTARLQPVSVKIVAACFVGALTNPACLKRTYEVCGPDQLTAVELLDCLFEVSGRKRRKLRIPSAVARLQATVLETTVGAFLHKPPPLTRDQVLMLQEDNVGDPSAVEELFGLKQESFSDGIRSYVG